MNLSSPQKAAAILVAMGKENAGKMLGYFTEDEIRDLMIVSSQMSNISTETLEVVVEEFDKEYSAGPALMNSGETMQSVIEQALTPEQISALHADPNASELTRKKVSVWEMLDKIDMKDLINFLITENTHAAAYAITRLPPDKSAEVINTLEKDDRNRIVAGMITTRSASPVVIEMLEDVIRETFVRSANADKSNDGPRKVAGLFNELDSTLSDELFSDLADTVNVQRLQSVKSLMFKFEDIINLESAARSTLFDQVPAEVTTLALRDVEPHVQEAVLSALGQRA